MPNFKQNMPRNSKYIDYYPLRKTNADIIIVPDVKGIGKTTQLIRKGLIEYEKIKTYHLYPLN